MLVRIFADGEPHIIEAPDHARVYRGRIDDVLVYRHRRRERYLPTELALFCAREGRLGLRLAGRQP